MRKTIRYLLLPAVVAVLVVSCESSTDSVTEPGQSDIELMWGIGNEIPAARETPLYQQAPLQMVTSWFNKPDDLEWMRYYNDRNTLSELYQQGYAQELVIWLAEDPQYALSQQFQTDLEELIGIFKGNGPQYGPLYVVLFTEFETYSDNPDYFPELKQNHKKR